MNKSFFSKYRWGSNPALFCEALTQIHPELKTPQKINEDLWNKYIAAFKVFHAVVYRSGLVNTFEKRHDITEALIEILKEIKEDSEAEQPTLEKSSY